MNKLTLIICFLLYVSSCQQPKDKPIKNELSATSNISLIKKYFKFFNQHDWENMANLYSVKAIFKDPSLGDGIFKVSRKEIIEKYKSLAEMFPDIRDSIVSIYPSGKNNVIVEFISSGRAIDGTTFRLPICTIFSIESGKIKKDFTYYDNF